VPVEKLVEAGLEYKGPPDKVECRQCRGQLYGWKPEHDPMVVHKKYFPTCPLVRNWAPSTAAATTNNLVSVIKRLGYDEKYILIAIDACRQRWNSGGGDVIPLDACIGDELDELVKSEDEAPAVTTTTAADAPAVSVAPIAAPTTTNAEDGAAAKMTADAPIAAPTKTNDEVDNACKVCQNSYGRVALLTCSHVCCCQPCAKKVMAQRDKRCPVCNKDITGT
jgi:hypothetical protein